MNILSKKSLNVSTFALACAMSTTLVFGGCNKTDKPAKVEGLKIEKIDIRKVDNSEAEKALTLLSLNTSGSGIIKWADRSGSAGNYTYSDVTIIGDKHDELNIGEVELWGVHMEGEQANFDKIEFRDFKVHDKKDDTNVTIAKMSLVKPSPALALGLAKAFEGDEDAFDDIEGDIGFQAASLSNMNVANEDGYAKIDSISMGEAKDKTGVFSIKNLDMDIQDKERVKMSLGSIDVTGANIDKYKGFVTESVKGEENSEQAMANLMKTMNVYDPDFKTINLRDFNMDAAGFKIDLKSYDAEAKKKKGQIVMTQRMSPLSIVPPETSKDNEMREFKKALSTMGYDRLEFTAGGTSFLDEEADNMKTSDTYIEMKDGFRLSYDFDITGYKAFAEQAGALSANGGGKQNPMAAMGMLGALKFNNLRIAFRDDSIIDRGFKLAAEEKGGSPEALKGQAKAAMAFAGMMAKDEAQQKLASDLATAVTALIDEGGTLVIEMNPQEPVNLAQFGMGAMGGNVDIEALGLTISTQ